ncbi:methyl-accepting chemotaxis protein [Chitinibacteraceae bacterium HSL-7]
MSLRVKLAAMVALSAIAVVLLSVLNFAQTRTIRDDADKITQQVVPGILSIGHAEYSFARARYNVVFHIILDDPAEKARVEERFNEHLANLDKAMEELGKFHVDATDEARYEALKKELGVWRPVTREILALSKQGDTQGALQMIITQCAPQAERVYTALSQAEAYKAELNTKATRTMDDAIAHARTVTLAGGAALVLAIAAVGWLTGVSMLRPVNQLRTFVEELAHDFNFRMRVDVRQRDEIGVSLEALNRLVDSLQKSLKQLDQVGHSVTQLVGGLSSASQNMSGSIEGVSEAASTLATGVEEVTVSINQVADRALECDQAARAAGAHAREGGRVIDETIAKINAIHYQAQDSAERIDALQLKAADIGTVVATIKDIADQTNLLALNAAIEAARAGEQGRGFAVVADEVRQLAERTADSTQQIAATVAAIQQEAGDAVTSMKQMVAQVDAGVDTARVASTAINDIRNSADTVVSQISEISNAMREQSVASSTMARQVEQVAQMSEQSNQSAHEVASEASRLAELGRTLDDTIAHYHV